ncbi:MAG: leucine-rich repeat domain-containing protein [Myxococcota bacterium]
MPDILDHRETWTDQSPSGEMNDDVAQRVEAILPLFSRRRERDLFEQGIELALASEPAFHDALLDVHWLDAPLKNYLRLKLGRPLPAFVKWADPLCESLLGHLSALPEVQSLVIGRRYHSSRNPPEPLSLPPVHPNLKTLRLYGPKRTVDLAGTDLRHITDLGILGVQLTGVGALTALKRLTVNNAPASILDALAGAPNLEHFEAIALSPPIPKRFSVRENTRLMTVNVHSAGLQRSPEGIGRLHALQNLNLSNNDIRFISDELGELVGLKSLSLSSNQIDALPENIGELVGVKKIRLTVNQLTDLPASARNWTALTHLHIARNPLEQIPPAIIGLPALRVLDVSYTRIEALPDAVWPQLTILNLRGVRLQTFPAKNAMVGLRQIIVDKDLQEAAEHWARNRHRRLKVTVE